MDKSWFNSTECVNAFNRQRCYLSLEADELIDVITSNGVLWNKFDALMRSALKHKDFDFNICASSSTMSRIIREGVKEYNKISDSKIGRLSAEEKKEIGLALIYYWEG